MNELLILLFVLPNITEQLDLLSYLARAKNFCVSVCATQTNFGSCIFF